jgi:mono/diheme cytochrome c family protein
MLHKSSILPATLLATLLALATFAGRAGAADPIVVTTIETPGAQTLNAAGEGRRLYLKLNCYSCHGMAAAGGMGPAIAHAEAGDVGEAVRQGMEGGMRSYRGLVTVRDVSNLSAYLRSIGTPAEPTFRDWWVPIPPK